MVAAPGYGTVIWDGEDFTPVPTATLQPRGDFACVSVDDCISDGGGYGVVWWWDGSTWTEGPATSFAPAEMTDIECPVSTDQCIATGYNDFGTNYLMIWNGESWSFEGLPGPTLTSLRDLSCASAVECVALGTAYWYPGSVPTQLAWNGSDWFVAPAPPLAATASYSALSCTPLRCMAVGTSTSTPTQRVASTYSWTNP